MYLMINVIHTEVLKFIEQIFSINSVLTCNLFNLNLSVYIVSFLL